MKILLLLYFITVTKGSSLWSISGVNDIDFSIARNGSSVLVQAFVKDSAPNSRKSTKCVKFFLFTRSQPLGTQIQINDKTNLLKSGFNILNETKVLIHGFANSVSSYFNKIMKNAYLESYDYNIVVVDWSALCEPPFYPSAVDNAKEVGARTAELLAWLVSQGVSLSRVHILGHSIGAHIAGVSGQHLRHFGRLRRITGLDPAKPMFELITNDYRLSSDDADFVDCIHTCGGFLGLSKPTCSVDFYPNGGTSPQPGCKFDIFGTCSHQRAYKYFAESVRYRGRFTAIRCSAVKSYSPVDCFTRSEVIMGEDIHHKSRGIFYLETGPASPFSLKQSNMHTSIFERFVWYFN